MRRLLAGCSALALVLSACGGEDDATGPQPPSTSGASAASSPTPGRTPGQKPTSKTSKTPGSTKAPEAGTKRNVLAISVDGLNVEALVRLGPTLVPSFFRMLDEGAGTLNARTAVEQTVTLPNHASMVTGRRIDGGTGGHGVTWNDEVPGSVVPGQGNGVASVFDVVHEHGGGTALFTSKEKLAIFERSWDDSIDEFAIDLDNDRLVDEVRADLTTHRRRLTFLHLALPDNVGHASGWMTPPYLTAVQHTDELVGELLDTIDGTPRLQRRTVVVLTADHGGVDGARAHDDTSAIANFQIPFVVWGPGVERGDLYDLNPGYADPGTGRPSYDGAQPVRNGDLANLVTELLGLGPVPGSEIGAQQDLDVTAD